MLQQDIEYILWLCKRMVYKYDESSDIIKKVENILNNYNNELSLYKEFYLEHRPNTNNHKEILNTQTINNINSIFENIDLSRLL